MTRFPNPFAAVTELVARAFTIIGDRGGAVVPTPRDRITPIIPRSDSKAKPSK
jgi:hypothetical protein